MRNRFLALLSALTAGIGTALAQSAVTITVETAAPGAKVSPTMWGVFFEDINYGADGGLWPERVKNGSFEFPQPLMGWRILAPGGPAGGIVIRDDSPPGGPVNRHYLRVTCDGTDNAILLNEGFFGMGIEQGADYTLSVHARSPDGSSPEFRFTVNGSGARTLAGATLRGLAPEWKRIEKTFRAAGTDGKAQLTLLVKGRATLDLDLVSLLPKKTFKGHGLRTDLAQLLADLKPGFVRFPGGCIVEGRYLAHRYQWKTTIGPRAERRLIVNRWNDEFKHRPAPDYFQSFGLGFFEYFQLCEDLGAAPLPILNCGMACQFNSGELVPLDQLEPYIQDALDLIEFANGPSSSPWGARRAAMGHPRPFNLKFLGVGNEQWGPPYLERYTAFAKVLKARHPGIQLIASAGPAPDDERFHFLWPRLREQQADIVDEHCYARPDWFLDHTTRYDRYDRAGPKVFMGEYAAQSDKTVSVKNRNNWECALAEAAYMTGLERNAGVVVMSSYAPLFGHEEGWQWRPNLIWFDNLRVYGTPSYYVQQLFSLNRGDAVLPVTLSGEPRATNGQPRFYASATRDEKAGEVLLKVVNATPQSQEATIRLAGAARVGRSARMTVLTAGLAEENSLTEPRRVAPASRALDVAGPEFPQAFPAHSLTVLRLKSEPASNSRR